MQTSLFAIKIRVKSEFIQSIGKRERVKVTLFSSTDFFGKVLYEEGEKIDVIIL